VGEPFHFERKIWNALHVHRLLLVVWVFLACSKSDEDSEARSLAQLGSVEAQARVQDWVRRCVQPRRVLDRLDASGIGGRDLLALVDIATSHYQCKDTDVLAAARGDSAAHRLARTRRFQQDPQAALAALAGGGESLAIMIRRADVLEQLDRLPEAIAELDAVLALAPADGVARLKRRHLQLTLAIRAGRHDGVARLIVDAPLDHRPQLAWHAAADARPAMFAALIDAAVEPELPAAIGDRIERESGPRDALAARARAVALGPERAEHHDAHARALAADGQLESALAAWDRALAIAPAQPAYRLAPVRAFVAAGRDGEASARARSIAEAARARGDADALLVASSAAAIAKEPPTALALAREARERRPGDGRIAFTVAERLAEAGELGAAAEAYAELLVCGARGRPWHRHEVAGKLVALATDAASAKLVGAALDVKRACTVSEARNLAHYVDGARKRLATLAP
jgi:SWI/SNF-related matrix-associated actin-dependent regulator 1 of chromatin subfamily A